MAALKLDLTRLQQYLDCDRAARRAAEVVGAGIQVHVVTDYVDLLGLRG